MVSLFKVPKVRDEKHRRWVASLPCCVSGAQGQSQAAHIRHRNAGMGMKSSDNYCLPLSWQEHTIQHNFSGGEVGYWEQYGGIEKAKELANALYLKTGDTDYAFVLIGRFRK